MQTVLFSVHSATLVSGTTKLMFEPFVFMVLLALGVGSLLLHVSFGSAWSCEIIQDTYSPPKQESKTFNFGNF